MNISLKKLLLTLLLSTSIVPRIYACYIDLNANEIKAHTGQNITFYNEYRARRKHCDLISFPTFCCNRLSIETSGTTRWFFTSAVEGSVPYLGEAITLTNPSIEHVYAVRGETINNNWFHIYLGIEVGNPKFENATRLVYDGKILYVVCKNSSRLENNNQHYYHDAKPLEPITIETEIKKHLPNTNDHDWNNPKFQRMLATLFLYKNNSFYTYDSLLSSASLWPEPKNTLHKRQY